MYVRERERFPELLTWPLRDVHLGQAHPVSKPGGFLTLDLSEDCLQLAVLEMMESDLSMHLALLLMSMTADAFSRKVLLHLFTCVCVLYTHMDT